jgi:hypothetical protein
MMPSLAVALFLTLSTQQVELDSARHTVVLRAGPFTVAPMDMDHHAHMGHAEMPSSDDFVQRFAWPCDAWLRGFALRLEDPRGRPLPNRWIHHLKMVNFARRQLVYPITERVIAVSRESHDVKLPASVGMPVHAGDELGVYVMWDPQADVPTDVVIRIEMLWSPSNLQPRPISALPFQVDVRFAVGHNTFAVPPGRHEWASDFTLPVSGHLLLASGHLHDYGAELRLEEVGTGKVLLRIVARRDTSGRLLSIPRKLLAIQGDGLRLKADRPYRVVAVYDNPTSDTLQGAMGIFGGLFAPDDVRRWPAIDPTNADYRLDLQLLGGPAIAADRSGMRQEAVRQ